MPKERRAKLHKLSWDTHMATTLEVYTHGSGSAERDELSLVIVEVR
jgi:aromatic ring hydroxylase